MAIKKYIQGITIVALLMIGAMLIVMAGTQAILSVSPPTATTVSVNYVNITVTLNETGTAKLNWNSTNETMNGNGINWYTNKTSLANGLYTYIIYASDINSSNWNSSGPRTVTVNVPPSPSPPGLSNPNPTTPVNSIFGFSQNFNITVNQTANVSWKIGSVEVQNLSVSEGAKSDYISNATQAIGNYIVTATAYNANGTSASPATWTWNVLPSQGPPPVSAVTSTSGSTWINWTWTNPTGNFNYTIVKINTTFQTNTSNNYFNYTQFSPGSINNIALQTVDTSGNINSTVIQNSAYTLNTPVGSNINVNYNNVNVTFSSIVTEGNTTISIVPSAGGLLTFLRAGSYFNISSTAIPNGNISIELPYDPNGINESNINLYHWNGVSWDDVTTSLDTVSNKVKGNVTSLSPFVAGVPPVPRISKDPNNASVVTIENQPATFNISTDSTTNIVWYLDNNSAQTNNSVVRDAIVTFTVSPAKGSHNVTVIATNTTTFSSSSASWSLGVHSSTYSTGNRIWDGSKPDDFALTYNWNPMSFSGFYYNAKDDVGNENIKITLGSYTTRTISKSNLVYTTSPQEVSFTHSLFGKYQVIGFMADKYFAGYSSNTSSAKTRPTTTFDGKSAVGQGQLHKVLIDDDTKRTISVGGTLALQEGYVLKATDIDLNARTMLLSLLKDGNEVDVSPLSADETYVYSKRVGGVEALPLIMVRFDNVFSGQELQVAFLKGLFQISENPTIIQSGNKFRNMEITQVGNSLIEMKNSNDISLTKGATVDIMGDVKILVANNDDAALRFALSVEKTGNFEIRSTVYRSDIPPAVSLWTPYNFGMNIGKTSIGFYYDLDSGMGNETLNLNSISGRSIPDQGLAYSTSPDEVKFIYTGFGKYQVVGFMAEKYFAGYTSNTKPTVTRPTTDFAGKSPIANGALHKVLIDDDTKRTISVGGTIALKEGYVLKATDIDLNARVMLISLLKDGAEVDMTPLGQGETYVYAKTVGGTESLPLIMVRFESVFSGQELQVAFLKGIFQISDTPTVIKVADQFGKMEVRSVSGTGITMSNDGSIGLDRNKNDVLMGNIRLKVADTDNATRFYFAVDVTPEMIVNQLAIDAPAKAMAGDTIRIKITAGGVGMDNTTINIGTDSATTDQNGILNYTLPRSLKGTYSITASRTGYEKATQNIEIEKYVDYRLSIEAPSKSNQFETITIKVLYNGTAMSGARVNFDNTTVGTSDSNGEVTYKLETSGTHSISASKISYITVARDIEIREPYSEFKALDINITPNPGFVGKAFLVRSNITNVGTKSDSMQIDLVVNGTVVDNKTITLGAKAKVEVNFTRIEAKAGNVTVEIMGQSMLFEAKENPTNYLLIGAILTGIGAVIIYVLTSKGLLSLEILKQKSILLKDAANLQIQKLSMLFKK